jgi:3D (Asp-Asp-Asp) domain-containing protein
MKLKIVAGVAAALLAVGTTVLLTRETPAPPAASVSLTSDDVIPPLTTATTAPASASPSAAPAPAPTSSTTPVPPTTTSATKKSTKPPAPKADAAKTDASPNASGPITFYAAADNDPAGSREIAFPGLHREAGGTGTFADPLTFAAAKGVFKPGTKVYVPDVQRYFVLEDSCATCSGPHIDLWTGPAVDSGVIRCEESLTKSGSRPYQVNPPAGLPVVAGDLYRGGKCYQA